MKKILLILSLLILLTACSSNVQELEEVEQPEEVTYELEDETPEPYYNLSLDETKEIWGKQVTVNEIYSTGKIELTIDNTQTSIEETGIEEIIENLWVTMISKGGSLKESYVILKIEPLTLNKNQYLLRDNVLEKIEGNWFRITDSRSNGNIEIVIYKSQDSNSGESYTIKHGETVNVNGLSVTNVRNFYRIEQYAILEIKY